MRGVHIGQSAPGTASEFIIENREATLDCPALIGLLLPGVPSELN